MGSLGPVTLDAQAAARFLEGVYGPEIEMREPLAQGEWSRAYAFRYGERELVARFNPERAAFDLDVFAQRFRSAHVPIPEILLVGEAPGGFFAVSERAFGEFLEDLDASTFEATVPSLLTTLDVLRGADTSDSTGYGPWTLDGDGQYQSWADYLIENVGIPHPVRSNWREIVAKSPLAERAFREGMDSQATLAPGCPTLRNVIHSDLLNRNVFVAGSRLTGLIDWQCAMYGDHLYDLAWMTFWAPWHPGLAAADVAGRARHHWSERDVDLQDFDLRLRCYEIHIGLGHLAYNAWRRGGGPEMEAVAQRMLGILGSGSSR